MTALSRQLPLLSPDLKPFFGYFGGKWRWARSYPVPRHATIVEPFAGSAGYALRYPDRRVVLIDADPVIAGIWAYLLRSSAREILSLPDVPLEGTVDDLNVCPEARWLIGFWIGSSVPRPRRRPSTWMRHQVPGLYWCARVRKRIACQLPRIRHWEIRCCDYTEAPDIEATWFIDPPYAAPSGRQYSMHTVDYQRLGVWCRRRRGQTIVCEAEGASWLPFQPAYEIPTVSRSRRSHEALWTSGAEIGGTS